MKLRCSKCNKQLTQDMYMVPYKSHLSKRVWDKQSYTERWEDGDGILHETEEIEYTFKRGVCYFKPRERKYSWTYRDANGVDNKKEYIDVNGDDGGQHYHRVLGGHSAKIVCSDSSVLEGVIPEFKRGHGCCNYSMGHYLLCSCGNRVVHMYLDCYEDKTVEFIENNVVRSYK